MKNSIRWYMRTNGERCIHSIEWDTLCMRKEQGGMGFRSLHAFNLAMLAKHAWNFISNPNTLASRLIITKYFPIPNPSFTWKNIWTSQFILKQGCRWRFGDKSSLNTWYDSWLKNNDNLKLLNPIIEVLEDFTSSRSPHTWISGLGYRTPR